MTIDIQSYRMFINFKISVTLSWTLVKQHHLRITGEVTFAQVFQLLFSLISSSTKLSPYRNIGIHQKCVSNARRSGCLASLVKSHFWVDGIFWNFYWQYLKTEINLDYLIEFTQKNNWSPVFGTSWCLEDIPAFRTCPAWRLRQARNLEVHTDVPCEQHSSTVYVRNVPKRLFCSAYKWYECVSRRQHVPKVRWNEIRNSFSLLCTYSRSLDRLWKNWFQLILEKNIAETALYRVQVHNLNFHRFKIQSTCNSRHLTSFASAHRCLIWGPPKVFSMFPKAVSQFTFWNSSSTLLCLATKMARLP